MWYRMALALWIGFFIMIARADEQLIEGLNVSGLEQRQDDEEAPFDIYASNKIHTCGGKTSNVYRVYSEYDSVAQRRFLLALTALQHGLRLKLISDGCEGRALKVHSIAISR